MSSSALQVLATKDDFDKLLAESGDKLVVVDFTATWCPPCRAIAPKFQKLSEENSDVAFAKVDVDENEETASSQGIEAMPTFLFFKKKEQVDKLLGADYDKLVELIKKNK